MATTKNTLVQTVAIFFRPIVHSFTLYALCVCSLWIYFRINAPQPIIRTIDYSECSALNGEMWKEKHYEKKPVLDAFLSDFIINFVAWIMNSIYLQRHSCYAPHEFRFPLYLYVYTYGANRKYLFKVDQNKWALNCMHSKSKQHGYPWFFVAQFGANGNHKYLKSLLRFIARLSNFASRR